MKTQFCLFLLLTLLISLVSIRAQEPVISENTAFFISKPIREMTIILPGEHDLEPRAVLNRFPKYEAEWPESCYPDQKPVMQNSQGFRKGKGPLLNFEGVSNVNNVWPADPNGDVGLNHYVQTVNNAFGVWDKSGNLLYGPVDNKTIFASFPGPWNNNYWSDPVFKYDQLADRWVIISMSFGGNLGPPYYTMAAVSTASDPLGSYYCYFFQFTHLNDYPKLSVWSDGYYITYNFWHYSSYSFLYSQVTVADRDAMLSGSSQVTTIDFQVPNTANARFFPLSSDLRGTDVPAGSPCYVVTAANHDSINPWHFTLDVFAFETDWTSPANSSFTLVSQFDLGLFEPMIDFGPGAPQLGNPINVITIPIYLMYPLTYRLFSDHEAMVCCHTIWDGDIHYIKWYELRNEQSGWYIYQTGNYFQDDVHRFMPSISINGKGDIGLGYSACNEWMYPAIRFTGRRAGDSLGMMTFQEIELYKGLNYANTYHNIYDQNRWGDYTSTMVDPADDSTFWHTNMYTTAATAIGNWTTRIFALNLVEEDLLPVSDAGNDTLTCNVLFFTTQGQAENYSSILWATSGDGNFISNHVLNATYLRGPGDIQNQQVTLTMHLTGYYPGSLAADSMILYINKLPEVNAGQDATINPDQAVTLQGEVLYAYNYHWTTSGDGFFSDSSMLNAIYTPGEADIAAGQAVLTLTAFEVPPCTGTVSDDMTLYILSTDIAEIGVDHFILQVSPNPISDQISIDVRLTDSAPLFMQVLSSKGSLLFAGEFVPTDHRFSHEMDFSLLPPGLYFLWFKSGNNEKVIKLIKK
jgi:hypothetical protein